MERPPREEPPTLSLTDVHELLVVQRRRRLVRHLRECDREWVDLEELAEALADPASAPGVADTPETVAEHLEWEDLPLLDDRGVVQYDLVKDRVRPGENFEPVKTVDSVSQDTVEGQPRDANPHGVAGQRRSSNASRNS